MSVAGGVRRGFTLVEIVVAIVVLGVGALGLVATAALATRMVRQAEAREAAAAVGAMVLDSLLLETEPAAGERVDGRYRVRWTVERGAAADRIALTVVYGADAVRDDGDDPELECGDDAALECAEDAGRRAVTLHAHHSPAPPRLGGRP